MSVEYRKLWHILIDRDMKKKNLQETAKLTSYAMNKLNRGETVTGIVATAEFVEQYI